MKKITYTCDFCKKEIKVELDAGMMYPEMLTRIKLFEMCRECVEEFERLVWDKKRLENVLFCGACNEAMENGLCPAKCNACKPIPCGNRCNYCHKSEPFCGCRQAQIDRLNR